MKLIVALIMIFIMAIVGSGYLYQKRNYKKEVEFIEYKSKNNNIDYSKYIQLTPNIPKTKKHENNKLSFKTMNKLNVNKIDIKENKLSEREQAKKELKEELDRQMLEAMKDVD